MKDFLVSTIGAIPSTLIDTLYFFFLTFMLQWLQVPPLPALVIVFFSFLGGNVYTEDELNFLKRKFEERKELEEIFTL